MPSDGLSNRALFQCLLAFACLLLILSQPAIWSRGLVSPKSTTMQLSGHSSLQISADRAIVALRIEAEGSKQTTVSGEVRSVANEVLAYLRPLTKVDNQTLGLPVDPPVVDLSFTTFETSSWSRDTIIGQTKVHNVKAEIDVEFSNMDSLGVVLAKISKLPKLTIRSTKWKLSDSLKRRVLSQVREAAMDDLLAKFKAYMKPLKLHTIHAVKIQETSDSIADADRNDRRRYDHAQYAYDMLDYDIGIRHQRDSKIMYGGMEEGGEQEEAYTMESRTLKITARVRGEFVAY